MRLGPASFRTRILLVIFAIAVIPVAVTGMWLTRTASRSGEALLRARLDQTLDRVVTHVATSWLRYRSDLLSLGDERTVQQELLADRASSFVAPAPELRPRFDAFGPGIAAVSVKDTLGRVRWSLEHAPGEQPAYPAATCSVELPIYQRFPGLRIGTLEARVALEAIIADAGVTASLAGMVLAAFDAPRETSLLPLPFDPALLGTRRFTWGGDEWLAVHRSTSDPELHFVAAAPLTPFVGPFEDAAQRGTLLLAIVAAAGILAASVITGRMTRSLGRLATAARSVSEGDLETRVEETGSDEVGQVARAFNTMTAGLRRAMHELADRERLAAVGEFAASLAHEVRNPLTAIRIDLQRVEEALPPESLLRDAQGRALREIERLDATVSETLEVARSGRWGAEVTELRAPLEAALHAARPAFAERGVAVEDGALASANLPVQGDARSLEQVFLNLLLNAAAALGHGGRAWIDVQQNGTDVVVGIGDTGDGIPAEDLERVFDPLYTTRSDGTGLGLTVARRIVEAHSGRITIESEPGRGTTVRVHLAPGRDRQLAAAGRV